MEAHVVGLSERTVYRAVLKENANGEGVWQSSRSTGSKGAVVVALARPESGPEGVNPHTWNDPDWAVSRAGLVRRKKALGILHEGLAGNPGSELKRLTRRDDDWQTQAHTALMPGAPDHHQVGLAFPGQKDRHILPTPKDCLSRQGVSDQAFCTAAYIWIERLASANQPRPPL
jgi:hypothetical protein